ncbi:profilin [Pseudomonas sp. NA-150]|uniref:profilin n=1 Tax=Pseudomonas sp. NA-150 TaxID=3367525 RepID=UPI0037C978B8
MFDKWHTYLKNALLAEGLRKASIHNLNGDVLAVAPNFSITREQALCIIVHFKQIKNGPQIRLNIADEQYLVQRHYSSFIYGQYGMKGCFMALTSEALIIALHDEKLHSTVAAIKVANLIERTRPPVFDSARRA